MDSGNPLRTPTVAAALALDEPGDCLSALATLGPFPAMVPLAERPELVGATTILNALYLDVSVAGLWRFLVAGNADAFVPIARTWCRRIGAERAVAYLDAAVALLPNGRLPAAEERRFDEVMKLDDEPPFPLRDLDRQYAGAVDEMAERFRGYVRDHIEEFEKAYATPIPRSWQQKIERYQAREDRQQRAWDARKTQAEQTRATQAITRAVAEGNDPRLQRFLDEIARLTPDQWATVIARRAKAPKRFQRALDRAAGMTFEMGVNAADARRRQENADRARIRAAAIIAALPERHTTSGRPLDLRENAQWAIYHTLMALYALDELRADRIGVAAARDLLSAFDGLITAP